MTHLFEVATPAPTLPAYTGDPDLVSPGPIGFLAIFLVTAVTILLILDMTRRVRKVRYRGEIREKLDAEGAVAEGAGAGGATGSGAAAGGAEPDER